MPTDQPNTSQGRPDAAGVIVIEEERLRESFTQIPNTVLRRTDITPGAKLAYVMLLSYAWQKDSCFPGQETLARDIGVSRRSVITYLQELQSKGLLSVKRRGLGLTNLYTITRWANSGSAEFSLPDAKNSASPEVQNLRTKNTQTEEYPALHINSISTDTSSNLGNSKTLGGLGGSERDSYAQPPVERPVRTRSSSPTAVGEILATRPRAARGRAPKPVPYIAQLLTDWSGELHDEEHTRSNVSQAMRLFKASGLTEDAFVARLYEARSRTKHRTNIAREMDSKLPGLKNKMPYYFAVLRDLLGLREGHGSTPSPPPGAGAAPDAP